MRTKVVGQGYVGMPLALAACETEHQVVGIDRDLLRIRMLNSGQSTICDVSDFQIQNQSSNYRASIVKAEVNDADMMILCLQTPLNNERLLDHFILLEAAKKVATFLDGSGLIINESTVEPGFTRTQLQISDENRTNSRIAESNQSR
jgi:UDP-N-acetyl-D-glucosamine dehydrogenase